MQVVPTSLLSDQQASLPESQEIQTNGDAAADDSPLEADLSDSTDSEMENDDPAADGEYVCCEFDSHPIHHSFIHFFKHITCVCVCVCVADLVDSVPGVLQCEFCGSRGYAHTFLRSKRFCSMTCVRR